MATIRGMARMRYREKMEPRPIRLAPVRDFIRVMGRVFPMRIKFMILKQAPSRSPFATSILSTSTKTNARARADDRA